MQLGKNMCAEPTERYKVSQVLKDACAAGLSVCRTWDFSDGGDRALQISPRTYDERVFQGLDFVISEANKYGVRLILSFVNNYNDFGRKAQYAKWARNTGAQISGDDDFYTNPVIKGYYKNQFYTRCNVKGAFWMAECSFFIDFIFWYPFIVLWKTN